MRSYFQIKFRGRDGNNEGLFVLFRKLHNMRDRHINYRGNEDCYNYYAALKCTEINYDYNARIEMLHKANKLSL